MKKTRITIALDDDTLDDLTGAPWTAMLAESDDEWHPYIGTGATPQEALLDLLNDLPKDWREE